MNDVCEYEHDGFDTDGTEWFRCVTHDELAPGKDAPCAGCVEEGYKFTVRVFWESITSDEDGETVEGDHGIVSADGDYINMTDVCGEPARAVLDTHGRLMDGRQTLDVLTEHVLPADYVDDRGDELIIYAADIPRVDDDEPYVRSVAVDGDEYALRWLLKAAGL